MKSSPNQILKREVADIEERVDRVDKGGRRKNTFLATSARMVLFSAAVPAARLLREYVRGDVVKKLPRTRFDACVFILEQCLGKATQHVEMELEGDTYDVLVRLATQKREAEEAKEFSKALPAGAIEGQYAEIETAATGTRAEANSPLH